MSSGRLEAAHEEVRPRAVVARQVDLPCSLRRLLLVVAALQIADAAGLTSIGFVDWRPTLYAFLAWCVALAIAQVLEHGVLGQQRLFVLPALLFTGAMVIFPTLFGLSIAFTDWNLNAQGGHHFNGLDNLRTLWGDSYFWNALGNMVFYVLTVLVQYVIAFGLALLLNADIRGRKFFRIAFLLPFMLSPVAIGWMIGKSLMENRFGPLANFARWLGWSNVAFFTDPWIARTAIIAMDAWVWIPFMVILLLAGLQALPNEVKEAAKVDGATGWQSFWEITFPAHAAGQHNGDRAAHHLRTEARRHRHQRHRGGAGRRDGHDLQLRLPRIPRSLECRLCDDGGRGLSRHHHRLHHAASERGQPLRAEGDMRRAIRTESSR